MDILKLSYKKRSFPQRPSRETIIIIVVIIIVAAIIIDSDFFRLLIILILGISYLLSSLTSKTLVYQKSNKLLTFKHWNTETRKEQVVDMSFNWFNIIIIAGSMYDASGMKKSYRYRLHLLCEMTLDNGEVIKVMSECPPWQSIPKGWPYRQPEITRGETIFKVPSIT